MAKITIYFLVFTTLCLIGCTDEVLLEPTETQKLFPYQTFYDEETFRERRDDLVNILPENSFALVATNELYRRNGDIDYEFRPASNFYYLTGFEEPNSVALIRKNDTDSELILFVETRDEYVSQWIGPVYGPEGAVEHFGADSAYSYEQLGGYLRTVAESGVYQHICINLDTNPTVAETFHDAAGSDFGIVDLDRFVDSLRVIKSDIEIEAIQKAVDVSGQAFYEAMQIIKPGIYEYEIEAQFDYILRLNGCPRDAFPIIVASGPNINILHYQENSRKMQGGELVMIDLGAEYSNYAADITRTLPVSGSYSNEQRAIYNIVLAAHEEVIRLAAPGVSYYYLYQLSRAMIIDGLLGWGIISGNRDEIISSSRYRQYIPAGLGHCVGLDVHDPFPKEPGGDKILKENMVLAIEPHVYLYEGDETVNSAFWNISVRIEDDIVITRDGNRVLSEKLPREPSELEHWMNWAD